MTKTVLTNIIDATASISQNLNQRICYPNTRKVSGFIFGTISFFFCFGACKLSDELGNRKTRPERSSFITRFHSSNNLLNYVRGYRKAFKSTLSEDQKRRNSSQRSLPLSLRVA